MRRTLPGTIAFALAALLAPALAGAQIPDGVTSATWSEVRSPHVRVITDCGVERADRLAERIERLREQLSRMTPSLARDPAQSDVVFLFRNSETFRAYLPLYQGRPEEDTGLYQPSPTRGYVLLQDDSDAQLDRVALHESTHAMLHAAIHQVPLWLDEGLAQYLSTLRVDDADARVGEPLPEMIDWLRSHDRLPMNDLLGMQGDSPDYHAGDRRRTFYAQSWLLVHLLLTGQYADDQRFDRYLAALAQGTPAASAFSASFGDPQRLQWQLDAQLQRATIAPMEWSFPVPYSRMRVERREGVAIPEVLTLLGGMLRWRSGGVAMAADHARAALQLDPGNNAAQVLLMQLHDGMTASAEVAQGGDGESEFDREQRAIGAYNTGVAAYNRGEIGLAHAQFRAAAALARRPDLVAKIANAQCAVQRTGAYARLDELHAMIAGGRHEQARRLVAQLLASDVDDTLRRSLGRLAAVLNAR
jgi:hypothetical protein